MFVHDDVRTLTAGLVRERCGRLPSVIVGSPPCQDASCANAGGRGVDGERTGLFFEAIRIVGECRPVWGCFENVPGLRGRGLDRVLDGLEAEGYTVWPLVMGADDFGAPHRRKRLWIVFADSAEVRREADQPLARRAGKAIEEGRLLEPVGSAESSDLSGDGRGSGVARRSDPGAAGARKRAFYGAATDLDATREPMGVAGQPRAERLGDPADAGCLGAGHGPASPRLVASGDAGAQGPRSGGDVRHPDGAGLAVVEGERGDAFAQLPPVIRTIAEGSRWNGGAAGLARSLRMADGLPSGMARQCIAAFGDAVVPQITEAIGRTMMRMLPTDGAALDLFCGAAGGWSLGLHRAGYRTIAACEIDPWRRAVFAARFGE